jgi:RNA polymerase sigma-70 factor (ECF subfamily)
MRPDHELDPARLGDHVDRLYRAALALCGSREEAEDLVQDTLARVLARPRLLRGEDDLGYLLRALRNTFVSGRRTAARRPQGIPLAENVESAATSDPTPDEAAEERLVYAAISALPEPFRMALVAVDVAGLSYREAARALRVREGTLTSRLFRARAQVARRLEGGPGEAGPSSPGPGPA